MAVEFVAVNLVGLHCVLLIFCCQSKNMYNLKSTSLSVKLTNSGLLRSGITISCALKKRLLLI